MARPEPEGTVEIGIEGFTPNGDIDPVFTVRHANARANNGMMTALVMTALATFAASGGRLTTPQIARGSPRARKHRKMGVIHNT
jgi:hypothetical protein